MRNCRSRKQLALQKHRHLMHSLNIHNSTFDRIMQAKDWTMLLCVGMVALSGLPSVPAQAIDVHPTAERIQTALDQGKEAALKGMSPESSYVQFGVADEVQPGDF